MFPAPCPTKKTLPNLPTNRPFFDSKNLSLLTFDIYRLGSFASFFHVRTD